MGLGIRLRLDGLEELQRDLELSAQEFTRRLSEGLTDATLILERYIKLELTGRSLDVDTGRLRASWFSSMRVLGKRVISRLSSNVEYAAIHQFGGVIRPVSAGALTIPLTREARLTPPRAMAGLFVWKPTDGRGAYLARQTPDGIETLYQLRKSVRIKATDYAGKAARAARPEMMQAIGEALVGDSA